MRKFIQNMCIIRRSMQKYDRLYIATFYTFKDLLCDMSGSSVSETLFGHFIAIIKFYHYTTK